MAKRGTDHSWKLVRYKGDIAIYGLCGCGYRYRCSTNKQSPDGAFSVEQEVTRLYPYCPMCGARKKRYSDSIEKINRFSFE